MPENVECRSDSIYGERPQAFIWQGERLEVTLILQRWRSPEGRGFHVRTPHGRVFDLFYHESLEEWTIREL